MSGRILLIATSLATLLASPSDAQDWRREPTFGATYLRSGFAPDPAAYPLTAGGGRDPVNVAELGLVDAVSGERCSQAFITRSPDFRFFFEEGNAFNFLRFYVITLNSVDATLLVNQPDTSWRCNDDAFGTMMPVIDMHNPQSGQYDIWVGTWDASSHNPATFYVTEHQSNFPGATQGGGAQSPGQVGPQGAGLDIDSTSGTYDPVTVSGGFTPDPVTVEGTSGGPVSLGEGVAIAINQGRCTGWVGSRPSHILNLGTPFEYLRLEVTAREADADTTLILRDPAGDFWCSDDDGVYPNPRIEGSFTQGLHRIWVGSFANAQGHPYALSVTEYRP